VKRKRKEGKEKEKGRNVERELLSSFLESIKPGKVWGERTRQEERKGMGGLFWSSLSTRLSEEAKLNLMEG